jgi:hypothetical protein
MGAAAHAIAREIQAVDTSMLPWARQARDAHARAVAAVGAPLPVAERELLARLLPKAKAVGEAIDIPPLLQLVTTVRPGLQHLLSHGVWHRRFAQLLRDCGSNQFRSFMLRSGCGQGATAWVRPLVPDFFERSHLSGQDRWQPSTFRMGVRHILGYEPACGVAAALKASGGGKCPAGCGQCLRGYEEWAISNHLMSCAVGGGTQRVAKAMNNGLGRVFRDIGVKCAPELAGLSATSAHRPGDMVADPMPRPESADAGGSHQ